MGKLKRRLENLIEATLLDPSITDSTLDEVLETIEEAAEKAHKAEKMQPNPGFHNQADNPYPKDRLHVEACQLLDKLYQEWGRQKTD